RPGERGSGPSLVRSLRSSLRTWSRSPCSFPAKDLERVPVGELIPGKSFQGHFHFQQPAVLGLNPGRVVQIVLSFVGNRLDQDGRVGRIVPQPPPDKDIPSNRSSLQLHPPVVVVEDGSHGQARKRGHSAARRLLPPECQPVAKIKLAIVGAE